MVFRLIPCASALRVLSWPGPNFLDCAVARFRITGVRDTVGREKDQVGLSLDLFFHPQTPGAVFVARAGVVLALNSSADYGAPQNDSGG